MELVIYSYHFQEHNGGVLALYNLGKHIKDLEIPNICVKIFDSTNQKIINSCFNDYIDINDIDDNAIIIYPEITEGNPLNKLHVVRWILAPIGIHIGISPNIVNTWGKNELVYYFNSDLKFVQNPEKIGNIYKLLTIIHIDPIIKQTNFSERTGICYATRKQYAHKNPINYYVFQENLYEIPYSFSKSQCVEYFNKFKMFVSYDPLTFLTFIAAMCGCISVVYPLDKLTKLEWINTSTAAAEYVKSKGLDNLYGIAYGLEDIQYAMDTIHLVKEQWDDIQKFNKEMSIVPFINDMHNFENMQNTLQNNYF